jgi:DnaA N-terminal domain/Helix-turn-helix domain
MGVILLKESKLANNLKGENYPLVYYRPVKENVKIEKSRWLIDKDGQLREFFYHDTLVNRIIFTEEKVREFNLDGHGENLEFEDRNFTIVHNYLIRFWQHFIKADGFALLITLKSYCIDKDYCWPSLSTLQLECGFGSPNTVKKWLSVLESYGFVFRFNCMSADSNKKNMDESPIYKVRRRVPFLPKELYTELPEELQNKHDEFMEKYMSVYSPDNLGNIINYDEIYTELLEQGETFTKKRKRTKSVPIKAIYDVKDSLTNEDENMTEQILKFVESRISKPSFETWFKHCLLKYREGVLTLYAPNTFSAGWINERHKDLIIEGLNGMDIKPIDIKVVSTSE